MARYFPVGGGGVAGPAPQDWLAWAATHGTSTQSLSAWGGSDSAASEVVDSNAARFIAPFDGVIHSMTALRNAAPGAGTSVVYTLRVNGVNTALTCTITEGLLIASDLVNQVAVVQGDFVELHGAIVGAPGATPTKVTASFRAT